MTDADSSAPDLTLEELSERIEAWRQTRKKRRSMPEPLWQAAASLSKQLSIQQVSKALRLNYAALKSRVHPQDMDLCTDKQAPATFIELGLSQQTSCPSTSECLVEMQDGCGAKMRMHFRGKTDLDLLELGKAFWTKGR